MQRPAFLAWPQQAGERSPPSDAHREGLQGLFGHCKSRSRGSLGVSPELLQRGCPSAGSTDSEDDSRSADSLDLEALQEAGGLCLPRLQLGKGHPGRPRSAVPGLHALLPGAAWTPSWLLAWTCLVLGLTFLLSHAFPRRAPGALAIHMRHLQEGLAGSPAHLPTAGAFMPLSGEGGGPADTVVIYTFSATDEEYARNLAFFVAHGMAEGDGCDYLIIVQGGAPGDEAGLPALPPNARYVFHENRCYDWGTFGWAMAEGHVDTGAYQYIVFMNSSVRGPFLPPYWPEGVHWSRVLTVRLSDSVKLVGATISCETAWLGGDTAGPMRQNPHVQSYVMATDQVGLEVLRQDGGVFTCWEAIADTIYFAEVGSSRAILGAGYTLDALMLKYAGVDWTNASSWACNAGLNPYAEFAYDGLSLNPLEVLFVKVKGFALEGDWATARMAATYDRWLGGQGSVPTAAGNEYAAHKLRFRLGRAMAMLQRGPECFDFAFYKARSRDLPPTMPRAAAWQHFAFDGQFEGRPFRFTCEDRMHDEGRARAALEALLTALHANEAAEGLLSPPAPALGAPALETAVVPLPPPAGPESQAVAGTAQGGGAAAVGATVPVSPQ